jgi:predicted regulator of Ras-like GTPase activity (Roadblock/LC7/MglB family)
MPPEWLFHRLLSTDSIASMSSRSLAQLAGIDGATIVSEDGNLLAYGAIVSSVQGRSEGARTAAARTLSEQGLVLRISEDGPIQLFEQGNSLLTV